MELLMNTFGQRVSIAGIIYMAFTCMLLVALIVLAVVAIVRTSRKNRIMPPPPGAVKPGFAPGNAGPANPNLGNALTIASERYARGEITEEEYAKIKENLLK